MSFFNIYQFLLGEQWNSVRVWAACSVFQHQQNWAGVSPFSLIKLLRTLRQDRNGKAVGGKSSAEEMAEVSCYSCGGEQNFPQHMEYLTLPCVCAGCHVHMHLERKWDVPMGVCVEMYTKNSSCLYCIWSGFGTSLWVVHGMPVVQRSSSIRILELCCCLYFFLLIGKTKRRGLSWMEPLFALGSSPAVPLQRQLKHKFLSDWLGMEDGGSQLILTN